jgi:Transposase DDE domain
VDIHPEVLLAAGYAVFLLAVSVGLDLLARHSHDRSERYCTAGFTYHHKSDAWVCPEDQILTRSEVDHDRRLVRYRARPQICNHCPTKADCTDSDEGREVVRAMDPWPHSEAGRFHRGISLAITLIAALILVIELVRNHAPAEIVVLGATLAATFAVTGHMRKAFRASPANFPEGPVQTPVPIPVESLRTGYRKGKEAQR